MPIILNGDTGIQTPMYNGSIAANAVTPSVNMKNRIINGAMVIDQRNNGASVTMNNTVAVQYTVDRWYGYGSAASKFTVQQNAGSVARPSGFTNYLGATSSSAYSISSADLFILGQSIEGFNTADLGWGTANAATVTLSFWVRSSLTGTFGASFLNDAQSRSYPFTYTISAANTWEQKTITVAGDTSGTWTTNNTTGIKIYWGLGVGATYSGTAGAWASATFFSATGATSVVGTNGATFYITGVQLEVGTQATSFDYRQYGTELALCQRYFWQQNYTQANNRFGIGLGAGSTSIDGIIVQLPTTMRTIPTATISNLGLYDGTTTYILSSLGSNYSTTSILSCVAESSASVTAGKLVQIYSRNSSASLAVTAEL
jgi:hypothetical protein